MGVNKQILNERKSKSATQREARAARRLRARKTINPEELDMEALAYCVWGACQAGCAVRLGATRDMGAWAVGVYGLDDAPYTEYVAAGDGIAEFLRDLGNIFVEKAQNEA